MAAAVGSAVATSSFDRQRDLGNSSCENCKFVLRVERSEVSQILQKTLHKFVLEFTYIAATGTMAT